jgi:hypothetical protein
MPLSIEGNNVSFTAADSFRLIGLSSYGPTTIDPEKLVELRDLGQYIGDAPKMLLGSLHPILPLRGFEEWAYPLLDSRVTSLERLTLADRTVLLSNILAYDRDLEERVSKRLEDLIGVGIEVPNVPPKKVTIRARQSRRRGIKTAFLNEGTGANQLPFILVPVALTPPNETVLISEPEAHLHPERQCALTRMLLTVAKKENIQFFIETHSEHVLHTILNAVARGEWSPADVALYYFQNKNGAAEVAKREINQFGQVDGGLPGFFEQSLSELTDYLKALSKP